MTSKDVGNPPHVVVNRLLVVLSCNASIVDGCETVAVWHSLEKNKKWGGVDGCAPFRATNV